MLLTMTLLLFFGVADGRPRFFLAGSPALSSALSIAGVLTGAAAFGERARDLLVPLVCSFDAVLAGRPRFLALAGAFLSSVETSFFFGVATFFLGEPEPVLGGRPRARLGVSPLALLDLAEPADLAGRPRPFLPPAEEPDALRSPAS